MSNNKYKILIVEDEAHIRSFIETILVTNGYQVLNAKNFQEGKLLFHSHSPDLIILDLGLPDMDGLELIKEVGLGERIPIIVLSARTDEEDKVEALDLGANDYVTKPFGTAELMARVRTALRISHASKLGSTPGGIMVIRDMEINYDKRTVTVKGQEIRLTQTEYNIVALLSEHTGKVLMYSEIIQKIWGQSDFGSIKKLQVNMANIRKKIGAIPGENNYIINELGVGYRMNEDV